MVCWKNVANEMEGSGVGVPPTAVSIALFSGTFAGDAATSSSPSRSEPLLPPLPPLITAISSLLPGGVGEW